MFSLLVSRWLSRFLRQREPIPIFSPVGIHGDNSLTDCKEARRVRSNAHVALFILSLSSICQTSDSLGQK